jgi:hypothetical protein
MSKPQLPAGPYCHLAGHCNEAAEATESAPMHLLRNQPCCPYQPICPCVLPLALGAAWEVLHKGESCPVSPHGKLVYLENPGAG